MNEKNRISVAPDADSYTAVQDFLTEWMEANDLSMRVQSRVQVAADEIWSNIVRYSGASRATVEVRREGETLLLRFADDGKPYDPTAAPGPDVTLSAQERQIGGLGLHMVRKMTAAMSYEYADGENRLTLAFAL